MGSPCTNQYSGSSSRETISDNIFCVTFKNVQQQHATAKSRWRDFCFGKWPAARWAKHRIFSTLRQLSCGLFIDEQPWGPCTSWKRFRSKRSIIDPRYQCKIQRSKTICSRLRQGFEQAQQKNQMRCTSLHYITCPTPGTAPAPEELHNPQHPHTHLEQHQHQPGRTWMAPAHLEQHLHPRHPVYKARTGSSLYIRSKNPYS